MMTSLWARQGQVGHFTPPPSALATLADYNGGEKKEEDPRPRL